MRRGAYVALPSYAPSITGVAAGAGGIETSTLWNYKLIGRYAMPFDVGLSRSWKVQSGQNFGRTKDDITRLIAEVFPVEVQELFPKYRDAFAGRGVTEKTRLMRMQK